MSDFTVILCGEDDVMGIILGFLPTKDICRLGGTTSSQQRALLRQVCQKEIDSRAQQWKDSVSLGWCVDIEEAEKLRFAHEVPFEEARSALGPFIQGLAPIKEDLLDAIAEWCGGYGALLHARETQAKEPPHVVYGTSPHGYATAGPKHQQVWIFDIKCDHKLVASAILPRDLLWSPKFSCVRNTAFFKDVGDNDDGAFYDWWLSTCPTDNRIWSVSVSVVSPTCSETLLVSRSFQPSQKVGEIARAAPWSLWGESDRQPLARVDGDCIIQVDLESSFFFDVEKKRFQVRLALDFLGDNMFPHESLIVQPPNIVGWMCQQTSGQI